MYSAGNPLSNSNGMRTAAISRPYYARLTQQEQQQQQKLSSHADGCHGGPNEHVKFADGKLGLPSTSQPKVFGDRRRLPSAESMATTMKMSNNNLPVAVRPDQSRGIQQDNTTSGPLKLVVLGSGGVGKSAITIQFVQQYFICDYDPTIADSYSKQCFVDGTPQKLEVLDTAGQDEFSTMREQFLRTGDGFLLVFSLTNRESLDYLHKLQKHIERLKDRDQFPMILVGNKCDLEDERQVDWTEAKQIADEMRISYVECSAKLRLNIDQTFYDLVRLIRQFQINERLENTQFHSQDSTQCTTDGEAAWKNKKRKRNCRIQ